MKNYPWKVIQERSYLEYGNQHRAGFFKVTRITIRVQYLSKAMSPPDRYARCAGSVSGHIVEGILLFTRGTPHPYVVIICHQNEPVFVLKHVVLSVCSIPRGTNVKGIDGVSCTTQIKE
ncbi:hypothetical protein TNCT_374131 [Trichonephila clavata]|uniref:Uncharacterized protein n=1 Tax=Trichonephila clavata TaxID=2740835 RepID=A0A8X6KLF2_TRICU|nr:hypothetical protein TNCT_374131 [Trichonephila clavata]